MLLYVYLVWLAFDRVEIFELAVSSGGALVFDLTASLS